MNEPREMEAFRRLQPLIARLEMMTGLVQSSCLRKQEVEAKPTFTRILAQFFNEDVAEWARAVLSVCTRLRQYVANVSTSQETGHKAEVPMTGVDEGGLAGWLWECLD